jgi:16S rRNA (cytosine967-C5)-methyltransferase
MALDTRAAAASVLGEVMAGRSLSQALPPFIDQVEPRDRGLLRELCYGSLRQAPRLQAFLERLLDKPLKERDRDIQGLLWCGLYQLESTRIPDHAAVAATVGATRALGKPWAKGVTNAILRRFLREREQLLLGMDEAEAHCHPPWLYRKLNEQWPEQAAAIMDANNQQAPMTLRVNRAKISREEYLQQLQAQEIPARAGALCPDAVYLERGLDVEKLPGFGAGLASVQDEAAQLAAGLLAAAPGEHILDACAAPGGKACHILELQPVLGRLVAMDVDGARLERVAENLGRLGLSAELMVGDGARPPAALAAGEFDRILVDAPCSASGVIRRHPDVKLLRRPADLPELAARQQAILEGLWPLLKPGGCLLYATCSLFDEENSGVVRQFLQTHPDAALCATPWRWGEPTACGRQLLPNSEGPDGLFYSLLEKSG